MDDRFLAIKIWHVRGSVREYKTVDAMLVDVAAVMVTAHPVQRFVAGGCDVRTTNVRPHVIGSSRSMYTSKIMPKRMEAACRRILFFLSRLLIIGAFKCRCFEFFKKKKSVGACNFPFLYQTCMSKNCMNKFY